MMRQRPIPQKKLDEVTRLQRLVEQYKVIGLANLEKMPASSLQISGLIYTKRRYSCCKETLNQTRFRSIR